MNIKKFIPSSNSDRWAILSFISVLPYFFGIYWLSIALLFLCAIYQVGSFFAESERENKAISVYLFFATSVMTIFIYALIYKRLGIIPPTEEVVREVDYYYFSVVTWTTLGYGDFRPSSEARLYAASQALLGYLYMGIFVGKVFDLLSGTVPKRNKPKD